MKHFLTFIVAIVLVSLAQAQDPLTPDQKQNFDEGSRLVKEYLPKAFSPSQGTKCLIYSDTTKFKDVPSIVGTIGVTLQRPAGIMHYGFTLDHHGARWTVTSYASPDLPKEKKKWNKDSEIGKIAAFINDCFEPDKAKSVESLLPNLR